MIKCVIFDFDGTVANTMQVGIEIFNTVAEKYSLQKIDSKDIETLRNSSAKELIKKYKIPTLKLLKLVSELRAMFRKRLTDIKPFNAIPEVIRRLRKNSVQVGIVTSNSRENVEEFLKKNDIKVDFVHGEKNIFGKGAVLKKLIKRLGLLSDEVVYVGDEVRDIEAARFAGVKIFAVAWGFNSEKRMLAEKPDALVRSPNEIYDKI